MFAGGYTRDEPHLKNDVAFLDHMARYPKHCYTTYWAQGGPIIEREQIGFWPPAGGRTAGQVWAANYNLDKKKPRMYGPTPLVAAMRCYVASKLGDEVDVPDGLT